MKEFGPMKTVVKVIAVFSLISLFAIAACKTQQASKPSQPGTNTPQQGKVQGTVIAKVGDHAITWEEFTETYRIDPRRGINADTMERLLDNYINQYLVYLEGLEKGYDKNPEIVEQVQRTERQLISRYVIKDLNEKKEDLTEEQMKNYYDSNPDSFSTTVVNYVLFYDRKYDKDHQKAQEAAQKALKQLKGGEAFAKVAEEVYGRTPPSTEMTVKKNQVTYYGKRFDDAVWTLNEGQISEPIETGQGFIIFQVIKREKLTYEQAKPYIQSELRQGSGMNRLELFYQDLRKKYPVTIDKDVLQTKIRSDAPATPPQPGMPPMHPGMPPTPPAPPQTP